MVKPTVFEGLRVFNFKTLQETWEGLNEYLCTSEKEINENGGGSYGPELISYNIFCKIKRGWVDPEFDFGHTLGYTVKKWSALIKNYVNFHYLDLIRDEVRRRKGRNARNYNFSYHFVNAHGSGKDCLISLTFTKRIYEDHPILVFSVRTSEVTKRLIFDLLLVQRIGEYVYGEGADFEVHFISPSIFISAESFSMYNNHRDIHELLKGQMKSLGKFQTNIVNVLEKFQNIDIASIKYKVNKRSAKQLQRNEDGMPLSGVKSMKAKTLKLNADLLDIPENIINLRQLRKHQRDTK